MTDLFQPGILQAPPDLARYLTFSLKPGADPGPSSVSHLLRLRHGDSGDAFEALMKRMAGAKDRITDALFKYTRPVTGTYFWCPLVRNGALDLRALGL